MTILTKGMPQGPLTIEAVPASGMKLAAALLDDPNPIHLDPRAVETLGLGTTVINQGPITISYLQSMIAAALGGAERIMRFEARFLANVFAGDRLVCTGTVDDDGEVTGIAILSCQAAVNDVTVATAIAAVRLADSKAPTGGTLTMTARTA